MKTLIPIIAILALSSCKKCYVCTFSNGATITHSEFCGTKKQKEHHELVGNAFDANGKQVTYMKCR